MKQRASLLVNVLLAVSCFWLSGCIPFIGKTKYSEELDFSLNGVGATKIDARTTNGAIALIGSVTDQIQVHAWKDVWSSSEADAKEFAKEVKISAVREGNIVKVYYEHPKLSWGRSVSVRYDIQGPALIQADLRTTNGKIDIRQIEGPVDAVTTNGGVQLEGGKDSIKLTTTNGKIGLRNSSGRIKARTTNGGIEGFIADLSRESEFSTTNGSIDISVMKGSASLSISTTNGSIKLALPTDFSGQLDAAVFNGRISSEIPTSKSESTKKKLTGELGAGGEAKIELRTTNGNINLWKNESAK